MIKKFPPVEWTLFVSYEGADLLKATIKEQSFIDIFEYEDIVDGTYGVRYELVSKNGSACPVTESIVDAIINDYMEAAE